MKLPWLEKMPREKLRGNSKSTKTRGSFSDDTWISEIENLTLNDSEWSCVIAMIVETRPEHAKYLELFEEAADEGEREAIFSLSYQKLIRGMKSLGKSDRHREICQFADKQIEDEGKEGMTPRLLCSLVKFFVNRAKTRNLKIARSRAKIEKEISKEIESLGRDGLDAAAKSKGRSVEPESFDKANTKLRKRGEEWRDRVRVDDAPLGGPDLYVVLSGFHDFSLATELLRTGMPLTAIFEVRLPGKEIDPCDLQLRSFWSDMKAMLRNPRDASRYSQVVLQTFCPPGIEGQELEALKNDAYRRISFLMYDLSDLKRQHGRYIAKMKLQGGLGVGKPGVLDNARYLDIMSLVPEECFSVSIILDALLSQIDGSETRKDAFRQKLEEPLEKLEERVRLKIDDLNDEFNVFDVGRVKIPPRNSDLRLILHGDDFRSKIHHCCLYDLGIPDDFGLRVLRRYAEFSIWENSSTLDNEQVEIYDRHIGRISECLGADVDNSTTRHYLHLLLFHELINDLLESDDPGRKISLPRIEKLPPELNDEHAKSRIIAGNKSGDKSSPTSRQSESSIRHSKKISETYECPELFGLLDARETPNSGILDLDEFDTVQLLSPDVFSQIFFSCYQEFGAPDIRYFAPTDSALIFFRDAPFEEISRQEYTASIRTPVCLRDFGRFVVSEEREWIEREEEERGKKLVKEEAASYGKVQIQKDVEAPSLADLYTDADFILPNSIKGEELRKQKSRQALIDGTETATLSGEKLPAQTKGRPRRDEETNPGRVRVPKRKGKPREPGEALATDASVPLFADTTSILSSEDVESFFLGYDIADHRVQVSGSTTDFLSEDGTAVKVNLEEWCYGERGLRIIVKLLGNDLVVHTIAGKESARFHLTTVNGILMEFSLPLKREEEKSSLDSGQSITKGNYWGDKMDRESGVAGPKGTWTPEIAVDPGFRVSWPSGLVVETLPGDGPSESFYIKQSYLSKGPECTGISGETERVFLRDGTILVFMDDLTVRLMRSDGRIVTCNGFSKAERGQEIEVGNHPLSGKKHAPKKKLNITPTDDESPGEDSVLKSAQNSRGTVRAKTKRKSLNSFAENGGTPGLKTIPKNWQNLKIRSSIVLDPDGRLYEIHNEEEIRELGEELVRTASDYEVGERFTRRSDGTDILIDSEGVLAVCFPDGSRITTGYKIEEDLVFCEWTDAEFQMFYPGLSRENVLAEDGFVSIFSTSCMEHRNYATVTYDRLKVDCTLSMPGDVGVRISSENLFSVNVGPGISLEIQRKGILFTGKMETTSGRLSSSFFSSENFSSSVKTETSFLETTDSLGNVFGVDFDGRTLWKKFRKMCDPVEKRESSSSQNHVVGKNKFQHGLKRCRLFAVNRDLSAYEHLRHSERRNQENDQTASIFFPWVNGQPDQRFCTTLTILNPITVSRAWLQSCTMKSIRPTNEDRKDLVRSTYSVPWNYLFPYGKNGLGIRDRGWNQPLKSRPDFSQEEEVLVARTTQMIKNQDENAMEKLREAIRCYWIQSIDNFHEFRGSLPRSIANPENPGVEDWLKDFALGRKKTFDRTLYFDGLLKRRPTHRFESRISKRRTSGSGDKADDEEIHWYKTSLRDRNVPPYFVNIPGACFIWVFECIDKMSLPNRK